jgi:tetratricopeptide (TPR) repeat protein
MEAVTMVEPRRLPEPVEEVRRAIVALGFAGARDIAETRCREHPDLDDLHGLVALITLWSGDPERAEAIVSSRQAAAPGAGTLGVGVEIAAFMADEERARDRERRAAAIDPGNFLLLRAQVSRATMHNDLPEALRLADLSLGLYPEDPEMFGQKISALRATQRVDEANALLEKAPEWFRATAHYHSALGLAAFQRHDLETAEREWRAAVAMCPNAGSYWGHLAQVQRHMEKTAEAEASARNSLDLNSRSLPALNTLAKIAEDRGDKRAAAEYARRAAEAIPALAVMSLVSKANALRAARRGREANQLLREAAKSPIHITAQTARSILVTGLILDEKWDEAQAVLDDAANHGPLSNPMRISRIALLRHRGAADEALRECETMLADDEPFRGVYAPAIALYLEANRTEEANALIARVQHDLPGSPAELANVVMALDQHGRSAEARTLHEAAVRRYPNNDALTLLSAGFAAEDGRFRHVGYHLSRVSKNLRIKNPFLSPRFWWRVARAVARALSGGRKR